MRLDGVVLAINFICRRIQPCKERVILAYEYVRDDDITREVPKKIDKSDTYTCAYKLFTAKTKLSNQGQQRPFSLTNRHQ